MRCKISRVLIGAATLATPVLVAASLVTAPAAAAEAATPKPPAVTRAQPGAAPGENSATRPAQASVPVRAPIKAARPNSASNRLVHICNHSNGGVFVALAEDYQSDFATMGWWSIGNTECRDLWARYLRVERAGNPNYNWYISPDLRTMCAVYPGPFTTFQPDNAQACSSANGRMVSYAAVPDGAGTYFWTLWP